MILSILAVAAAWVCVIPLLSGIGVVGRRALQRRAARNILPADMWIGLAAMFAYVQLWSLGAAITWRVWVLPVGVGVVGLTLRSNRVALTPGRTVGAVAVTIVPVLWLANAALSKSIGYDTALYHLGVIEYASTFPAVPGLGNLHARLGSSLPHLLFASALDTGPWAGAGFRLVSGLLVSMLLIDIIVRMIGSGPLRRPPYARAMAPFALVAAGTVLALDPGERLASPSIDLAALVFVLIGTLYLAEFVERRHDSTAALTSTAAFGLAAVTRPLYLVTLSASLVTFVALARRHNRTMAGSVRWLILLSATPVVLVVGWVARQTVLTGYPFYPISVVSLPVDWRMPRSSVVEFSRWVASWARSPGGDPDEVVHSWAWLSDWLSARSHDVDTIAPLLLLATVAIAVLPRAQSAVRQRRARLEPMCWTLAPIVLTLAAWFALAPDPRFVWGPLWLLPIGLIAWATPPRAPSDSKRLTTLMAHGAVVVVAVVPLQAALLTNTGSNPVQAAGDGPFHTARLPVPRVRTVVTASGLRLLMPLRDYRCWRLLLCTPDPDPTLRLRGVDLADGFAHGTGATAKTRGQFMSSR